MTIIVEPSGQACGAYVSGVDLSGKLDDDLIGEIRSAWLDHRILAFVGQSMDDDALERFTVAMGGFGEDPFFARSKDASISPRSCARLTRQRRCSPKTGTATGAFCPAHLPGPVYWPSTFRRLAAIRFSQTRSQRLPIFQTIESRNCGR